MASLEDQFKADAEAVEREWQQTAKPLWDKLTAMFPVDYDNDN